MLMIKDRLLLRQWKAPEKSAGGIILAQPDEKPNIAHVIAVGPEVQAVCPGNVVFLGTKWFTNLKVGKEEYLVVNEPDIAGIADRDDLTKLAAHYGDAALAPNEPKKSKKAA